MTIVNLFVSQDQAVVVSDSLTCCGGRPAAFGPKFHVFPHAAMVVTGRGVIDVKWQVVQDLCRRHFAGGIDGVERIMSGLLEVAHAEVVERNPPSLDGYIVELAVAGYSPETGGYRAVIWKSKNGFEPERQPAGIYLSPSPCDGTWRPDRLEPPTDQMWVAGAVEAQRALQAECPPGHRCSVGGDLFKVELTKTGIGIRKLCRLPHYAEIVEEMQRADVEGRSRAVSGPAPTGRRDPARSEVTVG